MENSNEYENQISQQFLQQEFQFWIGNPVVLIINGCAYTLNSDIILQDTNFIVDNECKSNEKDLQKLDYNKYGNKNIEIDVSDENCQQVLKQQIDSEKLIISKYVKNYIEKYSTSKSQEKILNILICYGIPNSKTISEVMEYFDTNTKNKIQEVKVCKGQSQQFYILLLKFDSLLNCAEFYSQFHGEKYNQIEDDICLLKFITNIYAYQDKNNENRDGSPEKLQKQQKKSMEIFSDSNLESNLQQKHIYFLDKNVKLIKPYYLDEKQLKLELLFITEANKQYKDSSLLNVQEMKKLLYIYNDLECAICKENLILESLKQKKKTYQTNYQEQLQIEQNKQQLQDDKKKQEIISILCGHYFHWYCLSNYQQTICPLCRYHQQPPQIQFCTSCGESENLWMCLLCGTFHCGFEFDEKSHIRHHYFETQHNFSMEIESKLVFDNYENQYVHRLLQNDFDGKIITSKKNQSKQTEEKIQNVEDILKQYEDIMGDQLQSQRKFFEDKLLNIKEQFIGMLNNKRNQIDKIEEQIIQEEKDKNVLKNNLDISNNELSYEKACFLQTCKEKNELQLKDENQI